MSETHKNNTSEDENEPHTPEEIEAAKQRSIEARQAAAQKSLTVHGFIIPRTPAEQRAVGFDVNVDHLSAKAGTLTVKDDHFEYLRTKMLEAHKLLQEKKATPYHICVYWMTLRLTSKKQLNRDAIHEELEMHIQPFDEAAFNTAWADVSRFNIDGAISVP